MPKRNCQYSESMAAEFSFIKKGRNEHEVECRICKCFISIGHGGRSDIKDHSETTKHKSNCLSAESSSKLTNYFVRKHSPDEFKIAAVECTLAFHTVKHKQSFTSMDCSTPLYKSLFDDSSICKKISCARTKTEAIITDVLTPHAWEVLQNALNKANFIGISFDTSNHGNEKLLPILVYYYSIDEGGLQTKLLDFHSIPNETSDTLVKCIYTTLDRKHLIQKCGSIGADNTNTNFGGVSRKGTNNVFTKLKEKLSGANTNILGIGCPAHIVHNTVQTGADTFSVDVEIIILKLFTHFSIYTVRVSKLVEFCDFVNVENNKILSYSKTRWLSLFRALERILKLYEPLRLYFSGEINVPRLIKDFFENPSNEIYMWFLHSQMGLFQNAILKIEQEHNSIIEVSKILLDLLESIKERKECCFASLKVQSMLRNSNEEFVIKFRTDIKSFYSVCYDYLLKWCEQFSPLSIFFWILLDKKDHPSWIEDKLSDTVEFLISKNCFLDESVFFDQITRLRKFVSYQFTEHSEEWNSLLAHQKWTKFFKAQDYLEQYSELLKVVEYIFSIPGHNANIERLFSMMKGQWTDQRNRLLADTMKSILVIYFNFKGMSCLDFYNYISNKHGVLTATASSEKYKWYRN